MATSEQLEAWASEATDKLAEKIGRGAQVIVMVADLEDPKAPFSLERRGNVLGLTWLLQVGRRIIENLILPNPTIIRSDGDVR